MSGWSEDVQKLIDWVDHAGIGDGGERPRLELEYDGDGWWSVLAASFDDGYADFRSKDLDEAAREVLARLTGHPERQREADLDRAAWQVARVAGISREAAREAIDKLLAAHGG